jgi:hypothetical protein
MEFRAPLGADSIRWEGQPARPVTSPGVPTPNDAQRLASVGHLLGTEKPEIDEDHRNSQRSEFPRPGEAIRQLGMRIA